MMVVFYINTYKMGSRVTYTAEVLMYPFSVEFRTYSLLYHMHVKEYIYIP